LRHNLPAPTVPVLPPLPKERIFMVPNTNDNDTSGFVA
jgi:hypothetical protein